MEREHDRRTGRTREEPNGVIDAQFGMTPMRRLGVAVSAAALAVWLALLASGRAGRLPRTIVPNPSPMEGH